MRSMGGEPEDPGELAAGYGRLKGAGEVVEGDEELSILITNRGCGGTLGPIQKRGLQMARPATDLEPDRNLLAADGRRP